MRGALPNRPAKGGVGGVEDEEKPGTASTRVPVPSRDAIAALGMPERVQE